MTKDVRILIVEDEVLIANEIKIGLEERGYIVQGIAVTGEKALEEIDRSKPDLILMDIKIRGERNGIETADFIEKNKFIPVIFMTGYSDNDTLDKAKRANPYGYVLKPINADELFIAIEIALFKHKHDDELRIREEQFRALAENTADAIIRFDVGKKALYINPGFERLSGLKKDDVIGNVVNEKNVPVVNSRWLEAIDITFKTKTAQHFEFGYDTGLWIDCILSPEFDSKGEVSAVIANARNITEKKELQKEQEVKEKMLARSERLVSLGELSASIGHEIREPLNLIKVLIENGIYRYKQKGVLELTCQKHIEDLKKVVANVNRINQIITQTQSMIKSPGNIINSSMNINDEIVKIVELFKQDLIHHQIDLTLDLDEQLQTILFSEVHGDQIIINLINNAINALDKAAKNDKRIVIQTIECDKSIVIKVSDNGIGIPKDDREKIFDPLFSNSEKSDSMGLGLYIVSTILSGYQSTIEVLDNDMGGATFKLTLNRQR